MYYLSNFSRSRSSDLQEFCEKGVFKNFSEFKGIKLQNVLERDSCTSLFLYFFEIHKNSFAL